MTAQQCATNCSTKEMVNQGQHNKCIRFTRNTN